MLSGLQELLSFLVNGLGQAYNYQGTGKSSGAGGKKNLPADADVRECELDPWVGKIPGEGNGTPHSSILAWRIPWTEEAGGL